MPPCVCPCGYVLPCPAAAWCQYCQCLVGNLIFLIITTRYPLQSASYVVEGNSLKMLSDLSMSSSIPTAKFLRSILNPFEDRLGELESVNYWEFRGVGDPQAYLGDVGDIYIDLTKSSHVYGKTADGVWRQWLGSNWQLIEHPIYHSFHLCCTPQKIGWDRLSLTNGHSECRGSCETTSVTEYSPQADRCPNPRTRAPEAPTRGDHRPIYGLCSQLQKNDVYRAVC